MVSPESRNLGISPESPGISESGITGITRNHLIRQAQVPRYREFLERKIKARIVLQLRDALHLSVPEEEIGSTMDLIQSSMLSKLPVPSFGYTISMPVEIRVR